MWLGKRLFDILFSLIGLVLLSPMFILLSLFIKIESPGPIFYRQVRVGRNEKLFRIHKFRSMFIDADKKGLAITVGKDPRITRVGEYIRKFKCDEFAQLIDVLLGDMSLVGPRPEVPQYVEHYPKEMRNVIFTVRPGITDLASIIYRNENDLLAKSQNPELTYINEILPEKLSLSLEYVKNASLINDLKIIFKTVFMILKG